MSSLPPLDTLLFVSFILVPLSVGHTKKKNLHITCHTQPSSFKKSPKRPLNFLIVFGKFN